MKNFGSLIPPAYHHQPGGIIGDRNYLEALKKAIEEALECGLGTADVFAPDGEGHYVFVKLEEDEDKIPLCYAHFEFTSGEEVGERIRDDYAFSPTDWEEAHKLLDKLESFQTAWERISCNLSVFLTYLFLEKCIEERKKAGKDVTVCGRLYQRFNKLSQKLFFNEKGHLKLPTSKEWREFFNKLWRVKVPDFCLRTLIFGSEEEVKTCADLSLELVRRGAKNGMFEGVGSVTHEGKKHFLFLPRNGWNVDFLPGENGVVSDDVKKVLFPLTEEQIWEGEKS